MLFLKQRDFTMLTLLVQGIADACHVHVRRMECKAFWIMDDRASILYDMYDYFDGENLIWYYLPFVVWSLGFLGGNSRKCLTFTLGGGRR